ncbi:MAG: helix-turn-helix domain-containing protein [Nocardioidaceae bacterium]|nr:helix-turn-helix domain-containing protein [Nocardioidaceae bacterium]
MTTPQDLVDTHHLDVHWLAGPTPGRPISGVRAVERLADVEGQGSGRLVVLTTSATDHAPAYELDIATRLAGAHGCAALLFVGKAEVPRTCRHLAERSGLVLLTTPETPDIARLIIRLDRLVTTTAAATLERLAAVQAALADGEADATELLDRAGAAIGLHFAYVGPEDATAADPGAVLAGEQLVGVVRAPDDEAAQLALPIVAAAVSRARQRELARLFAPTQTRGEVIAQLAFAESGHLPALVEQARRTGLRLEAHHAAAWLDLGPADASDADALARRRHQLGQVELAGLQLFGEMSGSWHIAAVTGNLLVTGTSEGSPERLLAGLRDGLGRLLGSNDGVIDTYVGVGGPWQGVDGLRTAVTEARMAASIAREKQRARVPHQFDGTGISRVLAELAASPTSRKVLDDVLAPLDELGPEKSDQAVRTLLAYLDEQCSPSRAAKVLHLHPNAVTYRIRRLQPLLDLDLESPGDRFTLHLACRVRAAG